MSDWTHTVAVFGATIQSEDALFTGVADHLPCPAARGLAVYRNNYRGNLHDALLGTYPVLAQLVGADFFRFLARKFIERTPSKSGNLSDYGARLGDFIADFPAAQNLPYLADVARLEWWYHRAYFAEDARPLELAKLSQVAPENYPQLRWKTHPAAFLMRSPYPVVAIWQAHQGDLRHEFQFDAASAGDAVLISRSEGEVMLHRLPPDWFIWLEALQNGAALGEASVAAGEDFDLSAALSYAVQHGVLIDLTLHDKDLSSPPDQGGYGGLGESA